MIYSYLTWTPVLVALGVVLVNRWIENSWIKFLIGLIFSAVLFWLEIDQQSVFLYIRALLIEPSAGLVLFSLAYLCRTLLTSNSKDLIQQDKLLFCILIVGIVLYPLALGLGYIDIYAFGYHPYLSLGILVVALVFWWTPNTKQLAVWLTLALIFSSYELGESDNVFDYLLDPIVFAIALGQSFKLLCRKVIFTVKSRTT